MLPLLVVEGCSFTRNALIEGILSDIKPAGFLVDISRYIFSIILSNSPLLIPLSRAAIDGTTTYLGLWDRIQY